MAAAAIAAAIEEQLVGVDSRTASAELAPFAVEMASWIFVVEHDPFEVEAQPAEPAAVIPAAVEPVAEAAKTAAELDESIVGPVGRQVGESVVRSAEGLVAIFVEQPAPEEAAEQRAGVPVAERLVEFSCGPPCGKSG